MTVFSFLLEGEASALESALPILMTVGLFVILYFFMIRPGKKQEKKDAEMRNALQVGDEVTTIGGIIGKVVSIKGETFVLETTRDKTKIRFLKAADIAATVIEGNKNEQVAETEQVEETQPEATEENN